MPHAVHASHSATPTPPRNSGNKTALFLLGILAVTGGAAGSYLLWRDGEHERAQAVIAATPKEDLQRYVERRDLQARPALRAARRQSAEGSEIARADTSSSLPENVKTKSKTAKPGADFYIKPAIDRRWSDAMDIAFTPPPEGFSLTPEVLEHIKKLLPFEVPEEKIAAGVGRIQEYVSKYAFAANPSISLEELETVMAKTYVTFKLYELVEEGNRYLNGGNTDRLLSLEELLQRLDTRQLEEVGRNVNNRSATDHWRLDPEITDELDTFIDDYAREPEMQTPAGSGK